MNEHPAMYLVWIDGEGTEIFPTLADAEECVGKIEEENRLRCNRDGEWRGDTALRIYRLVSESDVADVQSLEDGRYYGEYVTASAVGAVENAARQLVSACRQDECRGRRVCAAVAAVQAALGEICLEGKHQWVRKRQGGPPDDAGSLEVVEYCDLCGVEKDEE